ncbi:MAG: hypothetical protein ACQER4_08835 [Bacteroidota bacterium]
MHAFHIPVMGTGHSLDTPIRVAHLGIQSAMSVVDDQLIETLRRFYCKQWSLPYKSIPASKPDGREKRITAWLECVQTIVERRLDTLRETALFTESEKDRYFRLLDPESAIGSLYQRLMGSPESARSAEDLEKLESSIEPGRIEVNIMSKVDALHPEKGEAFMSDEYRDGHSALRGVANSSLDLSLVLSAGFNPSLYSYLSEFRDFYRTAAGTIRKQIVLKVSDFRSALIQGKFLAKKGLEVSEFRIESGLNCGGHAFDAGGHLLPAILKEFQEKREQLQSAFQPLIDAFYEKMEWEKPKPNSIEPVRITVQGGIGTHGEHRRLLETYGMNRTGWGSPFLLVPEATCVDQETMQLLEEAEEKDLFLSAFSPLGVPFNTVRDSGSERYTSERAATDKPGSACPKGFLVSNTEFTENPICTASTQYQLLKIQSINESRLPKPVKDRTISGVLEKTCLCQHLGNGALIRLGIRKPSYGRQSICPGPNIAWFDRNYSLEEMTHHIDGSGPSLVPGERPHVYANELRLTCDRLIQRMDEALCEEEKSGEEDRRVWKELRAYYRNLEASIEMILEIAESTPYGEENLGSIPEAVHRERHRLSEHPAMERLMDPVYS